MKKKFIIEKMTCASCVMVNSNSLNELEGVENVSINLANSHAHVDFDESKISFNDIVKEIESNGFTVSKNLEQDNGKISDNKILYRFIFSLIFSLPVFSMMFGDFMLGKSYYGIDIIMYLYVFLAFIVVFIFGGHFHKSAFKSLLKIHFTMDSLVSLGTLTAFIYSVFALVFNLGIVYFEAAVAIITLINLGKYLEYRAKSKAGDAIGKLLELGAKQAYVLSGEEIIQKDIDDINVGEVIIVKAGEKIALDGVVIKGATNCDESMLTGESIPVYKEDGSDCFGGTIALDGNINIKVSKINSQGTLANIISLVNDAQSSKAPIEHLADRVSSIFVPTIIVISIITFISWYVISENMSDAIIAAVATLVIACPCALGLATPTAIMVGTGVGAKNGILIKNAQTLEKTKDIDCVVFDKTGTLTNGKPEVSDVITFDISDFDLITIAKSLSDLSHHPFSKAISSYKNTIMGNPITYFKEIKGKGVSGKYNGTSYKLGNKRLFDSIPEDVQQRINSLTLEGKTPIIIGDKNNILGIIALLDVPKNNVSETINQLHAMNIEVIMLTGDTKNTAEFIGKQIGIETIISEVLPKDKLNVIKSLQEENKKVAFVGDGINDAAALTQSDLAIAMGTGSDIAIESSDIVLVKGNLDKVISAIKLSRQTLKIIKQNLFWAFVYNSIGIPLAAFGILSPIFASFAMSMSSVSVIGNSLRLKLFK